jgi:uncharacterized membrane protein (DUF485 family)
MFQGLVHQQRRFWFSASSIVVVMIALCILVGCQGVSANNNTTSTDAHVALGIGLGIFFVFLLVVAGCCYVYRRDRKMAVSEIKTNKQTKKSLL